MATQEYSPDAVLASTADTVSWGWIEASRTPVLKVSSGQTVRIDTVSHQGVNTEQNPVELFAAAGIPADQVLPDALEIFQNVHHGEGAGAHILTGPVYVDGAESGDMLEVRILNVEFRVPYGINSTGPGRGVLTELLAQPQQKVIKLDLNRMVGLFAQGVEVPLAPFMGIVAVAPPVELSPANTKPPGPWGGNLDFKHLTAGATLYLPVFNPGALFYTGDGHGCQGDGEVDGTAIEISLTPTVQLIVHKGAGLELNAPRAEDAGHYYPMGLGSDLNEATKNAVQATVVFLQGHAQLSAAEAYALCSLAVDFRIGEAVNSVVMVYGVVPKSLFKTNSEYWKSKPV